MTSEYATWHRELTQPKPTIGERMARWCDRSHEPPVVIPEKPFRDVYAWHSVEELIR